ncbi:hypothetical protein BSIN_0982 [Burkholderia singularis]|uniref:Uncharacterized protein n=1 Tax=Burkholderia singularis TaxID=1503053 RepID=A0A238HAL0_9BURK|nr:hypothetical protein BSIN_0982 [Burkholderia singularis]
MDDKQRGAVHSPVYPARGKHRRNACDGSHDGRHRPCVHPATRFT